ncbi:MAG: LacI family transcriptional regulator, partial [Verrucomicrobia bacterium]|nr:LacI family transcriptional regulator [Verrucomicrobiota bacterium]
AAQDLIRMQDIADRAGVVRTTVSLALRNHPKISVATRERIQRIAREMGYRPNPLVAAHMAHIRRLHPVSVQQCLAFLCNRSLESIQADTKTPVWKYFEGARQRAQELGFRLEFFNLGDPSMTERRLSEILVARGIDGVIVGPLSEGGGLVDEEFDWARFAAVMIEHTLVEPRLNKVCSDEFSTIGRLIQRLLDYGFKRIGVAMHSRMDAHANHFWMAGYQTFQALTERRLRIPHFITPDWCERRFRRWFNRHRPEAIITVDDDIVHWLRAGSVRIPDEVSCATVYWKENRGYLSGYYQNHELMGAAATEMVAAQLNRNERGLPALDTTMLIQSVWREGATLRRRTPADKQADLRVWKR